MPSIVWIVLAVLVCAVIVWRLLSPSFDNALSTALKQGQVKPILDVIEKVSPAGQTAAFNHAIRRLWDAYERPLATEVVKELVERHGESLIAQYWLKQVMTVEPEIARTHLTREFFEEHFRPELAAQCGSSG